MRYNRFYWSVKQSKTEGKCICIMILSKSSPLDVSRVFANYFGAYYALRVREMTEDEIVSHSHLLPEALFMREYPAMFIEIYL